ncbi:MAG: SDR family NAD(P)-dependent oxidoreductase, partial [Gemmatimonadota bacterium]|nr:SDR family NAD(P)-dependent oxidoreductase [Gemmatimonadota bacterium]
MIPKNLTNRTAIITGAAQGIGKAIAIRLAEAGASVAIADLNLDSARETAREIGADALALSLDVANAERVQNTVDECLNTWG